MYQIKFNTDIGYDIYENVCYVAEWAKDIVLNEVTNVINNDRNIYKIEARIKTYSSLIEKMKHKGYELTVGNMIEKINDLIGIRIVCNDLNEVYNLVKKFKNDGKFKILKEKDYIANPKKSGYTSYHFILEYGLNIDKYILPIKLELQIRTKEMDIWANIAHDLTYKRKKQIVV